MTKADEIAIAEALIQADMLRVPGGARGAFDKSLGRPATDAEWSTVQDAWTKLADMPIAELRGFAWANRYDRK